MTRGLATLAGALLLLTPVESITWVYSLHKYQMKVGSETYFVSDGPTANTKASFALSYLGTPVKAEGVGEYDEQGRPRRFSLSGDTSTQSHVDYEVTVSGDQLRIRDRGETATVGRPQGGFVFNPGPAPVSNQLAALHFWLRHGKPRDVDAYPVGPVRFEPRGRDTFSLNGKPLSLDRLTISGVTWGRLVAWVDGDRLVASIGEDAEFNRFEAVLNGFEPLLPEFVRRSADVAIDAMVPVTQATSGTTARRIAIVNGRVWDATGAPAIADGAVLIEDGRITAVGRRASIRVPPDAKVVDAAGGTILPGLWEMHAHYAQVELGAAYLAAGVTTVRDAGNDFDFIVPVRDAIASGRLVGPRMLLAGYVDGVGVAGSGLGIMRAANPAEGRAIVRRYHAAKFQQIKIYGNAQLSTETVQAITDEAHRLGLTVTGHVPRGMTALQAIEYGYDQINHLGFITAILRSRGVPSLDLNSEQARSAIRLLADKRIVVDPSFARGEYNSHDIARPFAEYEPATVLAPRPLAEIMNHTGVPAASAERARAGRKTSGEVLVALYRAGVPIVAGVDLVLPGHSIARELELYVEAGLTPAEALATATRHAAAAMRERDSGTLVSGARGDVIVVDGNPLERIGDLRRVRVVVSGARVYDPPALWRSIGFQPRP